MSEELKHVTIHTDGACEPNPGPGGYGIVLIYGDVHKVLSGGFRNTTNNRMEIYAVIKALEVLKWPCQVILHSDSRYVIDTMNLGWAKRWKANDWWRSKKARAENTDLWKRLLELCEQHQVTFVWVKGHSGNQENDQCDKLSYEALAQADLPADEGYEKRPEGEGKSVTITQEGQPCRKCGTPVVKRTPQKRLKQTQSYYYEYYFYCPTCHTMYMVEEAKRSVDMLRLD